MSSPDARQHIQTLGRALIAQCLLACVALAPDTLHAQDSWGGSLAVTNDYRVRGLTQTRGETAFQGGIHGSLNSGWSAGAWVSTVHRHPSHGVRSEVDLYAGFGWSVRPDWDAKVAVTHYWYPDDPARMSYDYDEVSASLAFRSQLIATVSWSPNSTHYGRYDTGWHAERDSTLAYELTGLQPITSALALTAGVGYFDLSQLFDTGYWYWNVGASYSVGPLRLDLTHIDSDDTARWLFGRTITQAGWSAALSWRF